MKVKFIILLVIVVFVIGCGNSVNSVKDGTLQGREQTTVGNAFNAYFNDPTWEFGETENKTQFVEFKGKAKKLIPFDEKSVIIIAEGALVKIQFILKKDGSFEIGYAEAQFKFNPKLSKEELQLVMLVSDLKSIKTDGTATSIQAEEINILLNSIYN